jgi:hypothetical protein
MWRFAELAARTGLEPELAERFAIDPRSVLAEFGIPASGLDRSPEYALAAAPAVLVIEELDQADPSDIVGYSHACISRPDRHHVGTAA